MRVVSQLEVHNKDQVQRVLIEGKKTKNHLTSSAHEAAVIAGEFIARRNNDHLTKLDEVIKYYKPKYLEKRGMLEDLK